MPEWLIASADFTDLDGGTVLQIALTLFAALGGVKWGLSRLETHVDTGFSKLEDRCDTIDKKLDEGLDKVHSRITVNAQDLARLDERTK